METEEAPQAAVEAAAGGEIAGEAETAAAGTGTQLIQIGQGEDQQFIEVPEGYTLIQTPEGLVMSQVIRRGLFVFLRAVVYDAAGGLCSVVYGNVWGRSDCRARSCEERLYGFEREKTQAPGISGFDVVNRNPVPDFSSKSEC